MQSLLSGDTSFALVYFSYAKKEDLKHFFEFFEKNTKSFYSAVRTAWAMRCFALRFTDCSPGFSQVLFLSDLYSFKDQVIERMKPIFTGKYDQKELSNDEKTMLLKILFNFQEKYPEFFNIMYNIIQPVLDNITVDYVIKNFGNKALKLFPKISCDKMKQICLVLDDPNTIFIIPTNMEMVSFLQNQFTRAFLFPNKVPKIKYGGTFALVNTAIYFNSHFIDVITHEAKEALICENFDVFLSLNSLIPILYHIFVISGYETMAKKPQDYLALTEKDIHDVWGAKLYKRVSNDLHFCALASKLTETKINTKSFTEHSFPYLLRFVLSNYEIIKFSDSKFIMISDEDARKDFDFTLAYASMKDLLNAMKAKGFSYATLLSSFDNIKKYFNMMSPSFRNTAAKEMFSLLFIEEDGKFVCPSQVAQQAVKTIEEFTDSQYIKQGLASLLPSISGQRGLKLSAYFGAGKEALIHAVSSKNWNLAKKIINQSSLYIDFYNLAYSVYNLVNNNELPPGITSVTPFLKVEYGFSSVDGAEALRNIRSSYPQYSSVIVNRINALRFNTVFDPINDSKKYATIIDLSKEFDKTHVKFLRARKGEAFSDVFSMSPTLAKFINYMSIFSRCCFDAGSLETLPLNLRLAFKNSINSGQIDDAKKLASELNIELFDFVMEHIEDYDVTNEFVSSFIDKHPLVCTAIAVTMFNPNNFPSIPDRFKPKVPIIDDTLGSFIAALVDPHTPLCVLDDFLFRLDSRKVYNTVIDRIDVITEEKVLYCIDIAGYINTEKPNPVLNQMIINREIRNITKSTDQKEIIKAVAQSGKVDVLIKYINANKAETKENMEIAVSNLKSGVRQLLNAFPDYIKYFIGFVPELETSMTEADRKIIHAFSHLPSSIKVQCDITDISSITQAIVNNDEYCHYLTERDLIFLENKDLEAILKRNRSINDFISIAYKIFRIAKDKESLKVVCINRIIEHITSIKICSLEDEAKEFALAARLQLFCNEHNISDPLFSSYVRIMDESFFAHLGEEYEICPHSHSLERSLFKLDIIDVFEAIAADLDLNMDQFAMSRAILMMKLGLFEEAFRYLELQKERNEDFDFLDYDPSCFLDGNRNEIENTTLASPLISPFIHTSFVNHEMIKLLFLNTPDKIFQDKGLAQLAIYQNIVAHTNKGMTRYQFDKKRIRSDYVEWCEKFMKTFMGIPRSISIHTAFGNYSDALAQCLVADGNKGEIILKYALSITMETNRFKQFLFEFKKIDPDEKMTKDIWEELLMYSKKRAMRLFRFEVLLSRGDLEEAAHEALDEFRFTEKVSLQLCHIGNAINCLIEAKHLPQRKGPLSDSYDSFLVIAELQKELCVKMLVKGIPHCPDLINDPNGAIKCCAELLKMGDSTLYAKVITMFPQHTQLNSILEYLIQNDTPDLNVIANSVKTIYGYPGITTFICVITMTKNYESIPEIIMRTIGMENRTIIANLLVEFDCLTAALAFIELEHSLSDLIPLIAIRASQLGDVHLAKRCEELMQQYQK